MKILLVDDSRTARSQLKTGLCERGWDVTEAGSGAEALAILHSQVSFDLIVTDQNMPEKSGTDVIKEIRETEECLNKSTKVIFLSSDASPQIKEKASKLGAIAFVLKPINIEAFIRLITKLLIEIDEN